MVHVYTLWQSISMEKAPGKNASFQSVPACLLARVHESIIGMVMGKGRVDMWAAAPADSSPLFAFTDEQIG